MSIINSDQYNVDWQLRVLRGLQNLSDQVAAISGATGNVNIVSPLGSLPNANSVSIALSNEQYGLLVRPGIIISSGDTETLITEKVISISFASNGSADALVTFDGGGTIVALPTGTVVNMDAGGINNFYPANAFGYDTDTNSGASLIITYNTL